MVFGKIIQPIGPYQDWIARGLLTGLVFDFLLKKVGMQLGLFSGDSNPLKGGGLYLYDIHSENENADPNRKDNNTPNNKYCNTV